MLTEGQRNTSDAQRDKALGLSWGVAGELQKGMRAQV